MRKDLSHSHRGASDAREPGPLVDPDPHTVLKKALKPAPWPLEQKLKPRDLVGVQPMPLAKECGQRIVDVKAFTGKGSGSPQAQQLALTQLHGQMEHLAAESADVGKRLMFLAMHRRAESGQWSLRWRGYVATNGICVLKHLRWDQAADLIAQHPSAIRDQMRRLDAQARAANSQEQALRKSLRQMSGASEL